MATGVICKHSCADENVSRHTCRIYFPSGRGGSYLHSKCMYKIIGRHEEGDHEAVSHVFRVAVGYSSASFMSHFAGVSLMISWRGFIIQTVCCEGVALNTLHAHLNH